LENGFSDSIHLETQFLWSGPHATVTRPNVKIQDGCNNNCSFCIIPQVRGREKSLPFSEVIDRLLSYQNAGVGEIVLTGIHIGKYGYPCKNESLTNLLKELSNRLTETRVRLSSVEPEEVTNELMDVVTERGNICDHFHIPLQSGSDKVLKEMFRRYRRDRYRSIVDRIHHKNSSMGIGTDVIVGFPGETDQDFEETWNLINALPFTYGHVFPYSDRNGTRASSRSDKISEPVKKERGRRLRELFSRKQRAFAADQLRFNHQVVVEETKDRDTPLFTGLTSNYVRTLFSANEDYVGKQMGFIPKNIVDGIKLSGALSHHATSGDNCAN
jgi:threonylcarbamoyladenosine tRNA methylthiotransferase MtaB